jgi:sporulation protein YqfC
MGKQGKRAAARAETLLALPGGVLSGQVRIELCGNERAHVEGCDGIVAYEPEHIRIRTAQGVVCFWGSGLRLRVLEGRYAEVCGRIASLEWEG